MAKQAKLFSKPHGKLGPRQEASGVADDMLTTARHATQAASRQVDEQPLTAAIVGFTLGYIFVGSRAPVSEDVNNSKELCFQLGESRINTREITATGSIA